MDNINLLHGDCLELMGDIPDGSVDMILTDPPYGVTRCGWDVAPHLGLLWGEYERIIKPNGCIAIFAGEPFSAALIMSNLKLYRYELVWKKEIHSDFLNAHRKPLKIHDKIQVFYKRQPVYHPQKTSAAPYKRVAAQRKTECYGYMKPYETKNGVTERYPTTVLEFNREVGIHPTQKPVPLLCWLIRSYTDEGDMILDPFMGSGSTGVACIREGRRFIGMEREEKYFEIARRRLKEARERGLQKVCDPEETE